MVWRYSTTLRAVSRKKQVTQTSHEPVKANVLGASAVFVLRTSPQQLSFLRA
jgi:hypothetical protein